MRLCRYGRNGFERPGLIDAQGRLRDLSRIIEQIGPREISPRGLRMLGRIRPESLPAVPGTPRLGVPYVGIGKFIAIGLNYRDHAREVDMVAPPEPIVFMKATTCINGPNDDVIQPPHSTQLDFEAELGVVIGMTARYVDAPEALRHVAGYCVVNDVSERAFQMQSSQWDKGKGCDTFGPIGPWLVTTDEIPDPQGLDVWLDLNGTRMQSGNTRDMIFSVAQLVSYVSRYMTLLPGDIIATGTPPGVGMGRNPPVWLRPGDRLTLGIQGLGLQSQRIRKPA